MLASFGQDKNLSCHIHINGLHVSVHMHGVSVSVICVGRMYASITSTRHTVFQGSIFGLEQLDSTLTNMVFIYLV